MGGSGAGKCPGIDEQGADTIHGPSLSVREDLWAIASNNTSTDSPLVHFLSANVCIHLDSYFFSVSFTAIVTSTSRQEGFHHVFANSPGGK